MLQPRQRNRRQQAQGIEVAGVIGDHDEGSSSGKVIAADDVQPMIRSQKCPYRQHRRRPQRMAQQIAAARILPLMTNLSWAIRRTVQSKQI